MTDIPPFPLLSDDPKLPIDLRVLAAEGDGSGPPPMGLTFSFIHRSAPFQCRYEEDGAAGVLTITGALGRMPFSAESPAARTALLTILDAAGRHLGPIFGIEDGEVRLKRSISLQRPVSAAKLVTALVTLLAAPKPYMELIGTYLAPPAETGGDKAGKVRPLWRSRVAATRASRFKH